MTREDYINTLELDNAELKKENQELKSQLRGTTHCFDEEEHNKLKEEITNLSKDVDMWNAKYNEMFDENRMLKEALEAKSYCKYANKCDELDDCSREEYEDMANANVRLKVENCDLKEENQELKLELSGYRQAILNNKEMLGLKEQNAKLKKHLKVPKTCNLKTLEDYKSYYEDTTREQILEDTYIEYCAYVNLAHRYSELQKQLEDKTEDYKRMKDNFDGKVDVLTKIETQQKEFINYLEKEIKRINPNDLYIGELNLRLDDIKFTQYLIYKEILQKYKSMIGDDK